MRREACVQVVSLFRQVICCLPAFVVAIAISPLQAQTLPDAGALRQQFERPLMPPLPPSATPLPVAPPAPLALPDGVQLPVQAFRFAGNTLLTDAQLQPAVQPWAGRTLGFAELQQATQAVANTYRAAGWIVRAYLPQQDVTEGVVTIQVVEAVFAGARLEGDAPTRIDPAIALALAHAQQPAGLPMNADALDRALLLADDLPGVSASGALEPGAQDGQTALALRLADEPLLQADVGVDNAGARATGSRRATLSATLNSPLRMGDRLRADLLHSRGADYARVGWSLPVGSDGWRVGANASWLDYDVVAPEFAALHAEGNSTSFGLEASYPLLRARLRNLYFTAALDDKRFRNRANATTQSSYAVRGATLGLAGNLYDKLGGGGANSFSLGWTEGRLAQRQVDPGENPALAGRFGVLRYALARQQVLTPEWALAGALSGQHASRDIDSSQRFYLGGPNGVRAYPVNEGSGSRGQLVSAELRWRALPALSVSGFYDWGHVSNPGSPTNNSDSTTLKGHGASVAWSGPKDITLKATWARRDGANPNASATGRDQDGSLRRNRFWLMASVAF